MHAITYEMKPKINDIKSRKCSDWTDELIREAIEFLQSLNPSLQLLEIIPDNYRPEAVIKATFQGKSSVFQASLPRICDCIINEMPIAALSARDSEQAELNKLARVKWEAQQKEIEKQAKENKKNAENEEVVKTVNTVIDRYIKVVESGKEEMGLLYHVNRCKGLATKHTTSNGGVMTVTNPRLDALTAKANGQYVEIGKEACFMPQAIFLKFKSGCGWKCKSKAQAEIIVVTWNARLEEMMSASFMS